MMPTHTTRPNQIAYLFVTGLMNILLLLLASGPPFAWGVALSGSRFAPVQFLEAVRDRACAPRPPHVWPVRPTPGGGIHTHLLCNATCSRGLQPAFRNAG